MTTRSNSTALKKKAFIDMYTKAYGNVSKTCRELKMARKTFYEWMKVDPDFKADIEAVEPEERFIDFIEDAFHKKIEDGCTTSIIFGLKTKGKSRGYIERREVDHSGELKTLPTSINLIVPNAGDYETEGEND